jgi:hypothetical protein
MEHTLQANSSPYGIEAYTEGEDGQEVFTAVYARQDNDGFTEIIRVQSSADPEYTLILLDTEGCVSTVIRSSSAENCRALLEAQRLVEQV